VWVVCGYGVAVREREREREREKLTETERDRAAVWVRWYPCSALGRARGARRRDGAPEGREVLRARPLLQTETPSYYTHWDHNLAGSMWPTGCLSKRERVLYRQPTGPNPLHYRDDQVHRPCAIGV